MTLQFPNHSRSFDRTRQAVRFWGYDTAIDQTRVMEAEARMLQALERPALPMQFVYPASRLLSSKVRAFIDLALATRRWEF